MNVLPKSTQSACATIPTKKNDNYELKACDSNAPVEVIDTQYFSMPRFLLTKYQFLEGTYDIHTFDETIDWSLENADKSFYTIKRVHDISWYVFGSDVQNISNKVKEYYYNLLVKVWMVKYYSIIIKKYRLKIIDRVLYVEKKDGEDDVIQADHVLVSDQYNRNDEIELNIYTNSKIVKEIIDALVIKYFKYSQFVDLLISYVNTNYESWEDIPSHYDALIIYFYKKLASKL
jgi:hypothetical protein